MNKFFSFILVTCWLWIFFIWTLWISFAQNYLPSEVDAIILQTLSWYSSDTQVKKLTWARSKIWAAMLANPSDRVYSLLTLINESVTRLISKHILESYINEQWERERANTESMHTLTNQLRTEQWLLPLSRNIKLDQAAEMMANDMAQYDYFTHVSPVWIWYITRLDALGYDRAYSSENLWHGNVDAATILKLRSESPPHKKNLFSQKATEVWYWFEPTQKYRVAVYAQSK